MKWKKCYFVIKIIDLCDNINKDYLRWLFILEVILFYNIKVKFYLKIVNINVY